MLRSLRLRNYRCFGDHEVSFRNINILVGANNAGKSTLVEALRLLGLVVGRYKGLRYRRPPAWTDLPARLAGVSPAMDDIDLRGGSVFHRYGEPPATITAVFTDRNVVEVYVGPDNTIYGLLYDADGEAVTTRSQARNCKLPSIAILPQIGPLIENERLLTRDYVLRSIDTGLASRHFRNQMYFLRDQYFEDFVVRAERSWPKLRIESLNCEGAAPDDRTLSFHVRDTDFVAEIGWMGHGLQMWLQTMWFLARSAAAEVVILDEPDVYMHADLQRRLIRLLRNQPGQTVIATHSVEIMAEVSPDAIVIVDKGRPRSRFAASLPAVQHTIDALGGVHNIHLARLWSSQKCLHVEGKDISLLKAFQDTLYPESDSPLDVIPHVSIGGWSGWPRALGSATTLKNSAGEAIAAYCILDPDYHMEREIARRYATAAKHGIRLHIWSMKEIENYLLNGAVIARLIASKSDVAEEAALREQVCERVEQIAEEMKDSIFDALCHEYFSDDHAGGVTRANKRARVKLGSAWETREGRRCVIPGKDVVGQLSQWAKSTFDVSFGPLSIAREMRKSEIPKEVRGIVRAIERMEDFPARPG